MSMEEILDVICKNRDLLQTELRQKHEWMPAELREMIVNEDKATR